MCVGMCLSYIQDREIFDTTLLSAVFRCGGGWFVRNLCAEEPYWLNSASAVFAFRADVFSVSSEMTFNL